HAVVGCAAIVDDEHKRGHGALGHDFTHGLGGRRVDRRRLWLEQTQLERWLVGRLHCEPAILAVARVGVDAETEVLYIEIERFILIAHVNASDANTLCHLGTSVSSSAPLVSEPSRRRFSETAIVRFGL